METTNAVKTEVNTVVDSAAAGLKQLLTSMDQWPISLVILAVLVLIIPMMRLTDFIPNRWIPIVAIMLGGLMNMFMAGKQAMVALGQDQEYPRLVLAFKGMLIGGVACIVYTIALKRFERYVPQLGGKSGDTMEFKRDSIKELKDINDDSK